MKREVATPTEKQDAAALEVGSASPDIVAISGAASGSSGQAIIVQPDVPFSLQVQVLQPSEDK